MGTTGTQWASAWVGVGSNLGDRMAAIRMAVASLRDVGADRLDVEAVSSVYETRAMGPVQPNYYNAALKLRTRLTPTELLSCLLEIENRSGRVRTQKWGPRTLDLDLLVYASAPDGACWVCDGPEIRLPHPELTRRDFVLAPLEELTPGLLVDGCEVGARLRALPPQGRTVLARLTDPV